ncbi:uncharacterized protein LOC111372828 [Olea europaea var. sylvestris]|uniref:Uncharacterized protein n=2 Tax=Olea europaea subsp. europaea TaxID=158383 RepID=A0A8S0UBV5_OLEEU|nr:uncharacterized protein LOC111372828 [Olea europaea var. sylvestris]CAA3014886.1 Hypothetical predicted protein [Olea europaea subsp. europaea]
MEDSSLLPPEIIKKKLSGQQKKEELEREVSVLHKMLAHEQKVHEFLQQLQNRQDGSSLSIPNYLPPKVKELLAELAMVENEIVRLESQISQLQSEVKNEKESNSKQWQQNGTPKNNNENTSRHRSNEKTMFEAKGLHFISKAIKGDYNLSDFRINDKGTNPKGLSDHKENNFHDEIGIFREKVSKRSGMLKAASPFRDMRHPTPRKDRNLEIPADILQKVMSTPIHSEEQSIHKWPPNKLSENIMKCLIFIFVRLLRTSRAMELEKSGQIARSTNFSLSFRAETSLNSKTSLMFQKDSRQQDPYGIFDSEESITRDIGPYKNLVRFTSSSMDPKCIQNSNSVPLFQKLKVLMNGLQKVDLRFLSHQQKLAFWINMYNASIMHGFLQYGIPSSSTPEKLFKLIHKATLNIAGNIINAQAIEHFILRKLEPSLLKQITGKGEKDNKEAIVGELYGLQSPDPNVIFALCCGTRSSPAVKIYTAEGVVGELERSKLEYLQASIVVTSTKRIALPELLLGNMQDFSRDVDSLMEWVCEQLPTSGSLRKSIVDCFRGLHGGKASGIVEKIPYEYEFQYLLTM